MQFSFSRSLRSLVKLFVWRYVISIFFSYLFLYRLSDDENVVQYGQNYQ